MVCPKCGEVFEEEVKFCSKCGFNFSELNETHIQSTENDVSQEGQKEETEKVKETEKATPKKSKDRFLPLVLVIIVAWVAIFAIVFATWGGVPKKLKMPDIIGKTEEEASKMLNDAGFTNIDSVIRFGQPTDADVYYVFSQNPEPGATALSTERVGYTLSTKQIKDYSNFGFENMEGLNEWIEITRYSLGGKDGSYIWTTDYYNVYTLSNGYLKTGNYTLKFIYNKKTGNYSNYRNESVPYMKVDNKTINFGQDNSASIINLEFPKGVPVFSVDGSSYDDFDSNRFCIPVYFIDETVEPEVTELTYEDSGRTIKAIKYKIDDKYLNGK